MARNFRELVEAKWAQGKFVCVGLDSELSKLPESILGTAEGLSMTFDPSECLTKFNVEIVDMTSDLVCAYKLNVAAYHALLGDGIDALHHTIGYIRSFSPDVPVILDAKVGDVSNTNISYVEMAFKRLEVDAITVNPYLGQEALQPFLKSKDKGIFVLCRTSNSGADEFQDILVNPHGERLFHRVARHVANEWNENDNCAVVVGATYPDELREVREIVKDMPILIPGIGKQGGDLEKAVAEGKDRRGRGMIINSSRGIIFASDGPEFAVAARRETIDLHEAITKALKEGR